MFLPKSLFGGFLLCFRLLSHSWLRFGNRQDADVSCKQIRAPGGLEPPSSSKDIFELYLIFQCGGTITTRKKAAESSIGFPSVLLSFEADRLHAVNTIKTEGARMMATYVTHSRCCLLLIAWRLVQAAALTLLLSRNRFLSPALGWEPQTVCVWGSIPSTSCPCCDFPAVLRLQWLKHGVGLTVLQSPSKSISLEMWLVSMKVFQEMRVFPLGGGSNNESTEALQVQELC